ncbi:uncharacterized protein LOC6585536 isoform X2 [Drosophila mojavensis]|uniref:Uncharacterized protein n=1 Tax=Drosophila mojavensis TaxID=7230 RepID=B4L6L0_DROMO|nr:uncharacterized protein LOC6585536 isoform X2 [Drosophila mojavensis]EDW06006.2 uncharacterized protein Dmoj_GI16387 [Drosophila mojavensis]
MEPTWAIRPQGFDIEQVRQAMVKSSLNEKIQFINSTDNVIELIEAFGQLMSREEIEFGAEPLAGLHVAGMMLFMLHHNDLASTQVQRTLFMQRCFDYMACTEETHVHDLCTQILLLWDVNQSDNMLNLILCCRYASPLGTMAQIVGSCLLWAMLDKLTDLGFDEYRLRPYPELMMAIAMVNPLVYLQNYLHSLNLIVRVIAALLIAGPYGSTEKLRNEVGVPEHVLEFPNADAAVLFRWLNTIIEELRDELQVRDGHVQERMIILEASCELLKLVHAHLADYYQSLYSIADFEDDGFVSDQQCDNDTDFEWLL